VVAHTVTGFVSDHPGCGAKVASPKFLDAAAALLTRRGIAL
jgi:hypothetical protein